MDKQRIAKRLVALAKGLQGMEVGLVSKESAEENRELERVERRLSSMVSELHTMKLVIKRNQEYGEHQEALSRIRSRSEILADSAKKIGKLVS